MNYISLRPVYCLSLSGGKDSLYMLYYVLQHKEKYPLDFVVHFELEIDFPFIKDVISSVRSLCDKVGVKFISFKPRKSWLELYNKYGYPNRNVRWCNSKYKLDCFTQLKEWLMSFSCRPIMYIGFCRDEVKRFKYELGRISSESKEIYPLAEENIFEEDILQWARGVDLFNSYYLYNTRCGCMGCPFTNKKGWAYLRKFYPVQYNYFMNLMSIDNYTITTDLYKSIKKTEHKYENRLHVQYNIFDYDKLF